MELMEDCFELSELIEFSLPSGSDARLKCSDFLLWELEPRLSDTTSEPLGIYLILPKPSSKVPSGLKITRGTLSKRTLKNASGAIR